MLLYAITNRRLLDGDENAKRDGLVALADQWASGGVDTIQLREKDLPLIELQFLAARVVQAVRAAQQVYARANLEPVISAACHTPEEIKQATGASMLLFSPIFEKVTEQGNTRGQGLAALRAAVDLANPTPVLALGGITEKNAAACIQNGVVGIAAIRLFLSESWRSLLELAPASVRPSS